LLVVIRHTLSFAFVVSLVANLSAHAADDETYAETLEKYISRLGSIESRIEDSMVHTQPASSSLAASVPPQSLAPIVSVQARKDVPVPSSDAHALPPALQMPPPQTFTAVYAKMRAESLLVKSAEAERDAAKAKYFEAIRKLYPNLYVKASQNDGDILSDVAFEEKSYGVALEHTLYQSGHLRATYKQAKAQYESAKRQCEKAALETRSKAAELFYGLAKAQRVHAVTEDLAAAATKDREASDAMLAAAVITQEEAMEVRTRANQAEFQALTAERDEELARLKLLRELGADAEALVASLHDIALAMPPFDASRRLDVSAMIVDAVNTRPDIAIATLNTQAQEMGLKAARSKYDFRVDLNASAGKTSSRYTTEPQAFKDDKSVMLKVTKSFGANTADYSYAKEDTSPKLGQTDRTGTKQHSVKLGLLDNFSKYSEIERARADWIKSLKEARETRGEADAEVYQVYFDHRESILRLRNASERTDLARQRLASVVYQKELNQATLSQVMDVRAKLADEEIASAQAAADHAALLYRLDKAIGRAGAFTQLQDEVKA
jgi:outer membrane protein TolC